MERQLIHYLPPIVRELPDYQGINAGEQPEFEQAWSASEDLLANQFVSTALDCGLSRWEKILGITPKGTDTLDVRRTRVRTRLFQYTPYTFRVLVQMLEALADGDPFDVSIAPGSYLLQLVTQWGRNGQIEGLEFLIQNVLPCNLAIDATNRLLCSAECVVLIAGGVCAVETFFLTNDSREENVIYGSANIGGGSTGGECFFLTNDSREESTAQGQSVVLGGIVDTDWLFTTTDFQETFRADWQASVAFGTVTTEFFEIRPSNSEKG